MSENLWGNCFDSHCTNLQWCVVVAKEDEEDEWPTQAVLCTTKESQSLSQSLSSTLQNNVLTSQWRFIDRTKWRHAAASNQSRHQRDAMMLMMKNPSRGLRQSWCPGWSPKRRETNSLWKKSKHSCRTALTDLAMSDLGEFYLLHGSDMLQANGQGCSQGIFYEAGAETEAEFSRQRQRQGSHR